MANNTAFVVIGGGLNALGVIRSLANSCHVVLATHQVDGPAWRSRYAHKWQTRKTNSIEFIEQLIALGTHNVTKPILLPTEELCVTLLSQHLEELKKYFIVDLIPSQDVERLQSKQGIQELAEQANSPIPRSITIESLSDLASLEQLEFPCIFKPLKQNPEYGRRFKKGYKVNSLGEISELYKEIHSVNPEMIAQEWINGGDSDIYFYLCFIARSGEEVTSFCGRKLRSWPVGVGGTASCTASPERHEELQKLTIEFCEKTGFTGLIGMEYKWDPIKKQFYIIEPTVGRTDFQHEVATLSGVNFLQEIGYFFGKCTKPERYSKKVVWRESYADKMALSTGNFIEEGKGYSYFDALFRISDPMPLISTITKKIGRKLKLS
ncbi:hypothetical protein MHO82_00490 [Vibrio sp. Of7-15]|uniref:carboxylate--amine ligase n=1 Tax=Vibrio sp. Of7-15 TaxID=2724879 RepID=UPI001EF1D19B|nr:hypothetical protein [Vibrio sp. Of7-15]MCG7495335.1 hypothetical protein [Vibrio sp. Of7-15]